jgi:hypothetical protein
MNATVDVTIQITAITSGKWSNARMNSREAADHFPEVMNPLSVGNNML